MICPDCSFYEKNGVEMVLVHIFSKDEILYQCPMCKTVGVEDL